MKNKVQRWHAGIACAAIAAWAMCPAIASAQTAARPKLPPPLPTADNLPIRFAIPEGYPADAPKPSPDPRNFEGGWHGDRLTGKLGADMFNYSPPFNPQGQRIFDRRGKALEAGFPYANASSECRLVGIPWQLMADAINIHQTDDWIEINTYHQHGRIFIYLDPAKAPTEPQYQGISVGHWEGDTLVVKTTKHKQDIWLDSLSGTPASTEATLWTRIRKMPSGNTVYLEVIHTLDDPKYYTRQWSWTMPFYWHPDKLKIAEYNCEEQTGGHRNAGLAVEPRD